MSAVGVARGVRARAHAVPARVWVGAVVICSTIARIALAHRTVAPWIMVDELIYSELAKSLAGARHVPRPRRAVDTATASCIPR